MKSIRKVFATSVSPFIQQITGEPRSEQARNVGLIDAKWFKQLIDWYKDTKHPPVPPIDNSVLNEKIQGGEQIVETVDYEVLEIKVVQAIQTLFGGDRIILRPLLFNPITNIASVIIYPIKIDIIYNITRTVRTMDPDWELKVLKLTFCKKRGLDSSRFLMMDINNNQILNEEMPCKAAVEQYGQVFKLSLKGESAPAPESGISIGGSYFKSITSVSNLNVAKSVSLNSADDLIQSDTSYFCAMMQIISRLSPFAQYFLHPEAFQNIAKQSNSAISLKFCDFVRRIAHTPFEIVTPSGLAYEIEKHYPNIRKQCNSDMLQYLQVLFSELHQNIKQQPFNVDAKDWASLQELNKSIVFDTFYGLKKIQTRCSTCQFVSSKRNLFNHLKLPIVKKLLRKITVMDCFEHYLKGKRSASSAVTSPCPHCGQQFAPIKVEKRKILALPKVLILYLERTKKTNSGITKDSSTIHFDEILDVSNIIKNPNARFKLRAIIIHPGGLVTQHHRSMFFHSETDKWISFQRSVGATVTQAQVLSQANAHTFVYEQIS